jgi:hypothetical protein
VRYIDVGEMPDALPDSIGCTLKPVGIFGSLLGREDVDEALTEVVEPVGPGDVSIQRRGN